MGLTEFLLARKTERAEVEIIGRAAALAVDMELPPDRWEEWFARFDNTLWVQAVRANRAVRNLGWSYLAVLARPLVRREAAKWRDHPEYQQEWRP